MRFNETPLRGAYSIELEPIGDERGFFAQAWVRGAFLDHGLDPTIEQMNLSRTARAGTFRGFHWQDPPFGEVKTVRCVAGAVFNVIIDMRPDSATYRQWFGTELSADNLRMLYIPERFANGFLILEDDTTLLYNVSRPYEAGHERGIRYDDPAIGVEYPIDVTTVSDKDAAWAPLG
ncbi:MAG: dTDP-4-dehydrorhamnose 3,5-epimerase family protein [Acidimicrobiia bacterium]|nr:dTDP-4-dehydrorhamnose 3,5-epimerase family protein [Acidimicrobiia bacterium]